jgi:hypothetical protein
MELTLSVENITNEKLLSLHNVIQQCNDAHVTDYIEGDWLCESCKLQQNASVKW